MNPWGKKFHKNLMFTLSNSFQKFEAAVLMWEILFHNSINALNFALSIEYYLSIPKWCFENLENIMTSLNDVVTDDITRPISIKYSGMHLSLL